jgi:hypothetical protein
VAMRVRYRLCGETQEFLRIGDGSLLPRWLWNEESFSASIVCPSWELRSATERLENDACMERPRDTIAGSVKV